MSKPATQARRKRGEPRRLLLAAAEEVELELLRRKQAAGAGAA